MSAEEPASTAATEPTLPGTTGEEVKETPAEDKPEAPKEEEKPKSTGKAESNGKPKSSSAAPKSKPASKRASTGGPSGGPKKAGAASGGDKTFKVDDVVLARLRGYPAWPARIADTESLPSAVLASRPSKNPSVYCVQFFPVGDFAWLQAKEIQPLSSSDINAFLNESHRKTTGSLREAYQTAKDPTEWAVSQDEEQRKREEADAEMDIDELADDDEEVAGSGAKRKRGSEKTSKSKKSKSASKKKPVSAADVESEDDTPKTKGSKPKAAPKAKKPQSSAVENQAPADDDPLASDPECIKVKDWRHRLQRAFLGKGIPGSEEMDQYNTLFDTIEAYKDMTIEALQYSKIGKVMKKIATLDGIPRNDEFKITDRASKLMNEWADFIQNGGAPESKANGANGDAQKKDAPESKAEESKDETKPEEANGEEVKADA